ncbi:hypothetical protein KIW84_044139 [Lathyrus oleraceus]|uniref:Uncharacterized protein n=1 Tax=Pisum sativum TaxID=3888 RepID=A0A9D5AVL3_PEA|nr:hypothetical protein KIW84_044139 [Pisum sativum]
MTSISYRIHVIIKYIGYSKISGIWFNLESQPHVSASYAEPPVSEYGFEEEEREYLNSIHIDDDQVDNAPPSEFNHVTQPATQQAVVKPVYQQSSSASAYISKSGADAAQQLQEDLEIEVVVEETPTQEAYPSVPNVAHTIRETSITLVEESFEEPAKKTYASILRPATQQAVVKPVYQQSSSASAYISKSGADAAVDGYIFDHE